ncbi:unnamed protein product [Meganyctiphanes norvegica]|uniref:Ubiquitin carboxyl-terminal hydrolase 47 n=1 Tax=Meganyctiphanes norvegica TaxID=48144 RepID=A0AAV2QFB4_MEGNR
MCLKETEARPREPPGAGPQTAVTAAATTAGGVGGGLHQQLQQATQQVLQAAAEVMLQATATQRQEEAAPQQQEHGEVLTNGEVAVNCNSQGDPQNNVLTNGEDVSCDSKDAQNDCLKDALVVAKKCDTVPVMAKKCGDDNEAADNISKLPSTESSEAAGSQHQPRKRTIKKTRTKMLPSFGQPYTFCIGLKNKRCESIDDAAGEGGGGGGGSGGGGGRPDGNTTDSPSAASETTSSTAVNGSTEMMNGSADPNQPASPITTTTTTTTSTTTTTTKDQPKLTNGVIEVIHEQKCNSERTDLQHIETRIDIEVISEESSSVETCSESGSTVSSTKDLVNSESSNTQSSTIQLSSTEESSTTQLSSTEATQVITSTQNESTNSESKCSDNTLNSDSKVSNNKIRKNDTPPKPVLELKKNNPFDDIRMGLKSVKKVPKQIVPKPAEKESNELNELFKRTGSLKRNKTPLRSKEAEKKIENDTGSRRGSIKGKLPPKKLSDTSMKSEDEKESKDSGSRKGSLKGKLPKKSSDTAKSEDENKERSKSKSPKKTLKKKTEKVGEKKESDKPDCDSKDKENISSLPNGTDSTISDSVKENGLSDKLTDIHNSQLPDKEDKEIQSPCKAKSSESKEIHTSSKVRSSESKERSPSLKKKSKSKSPNKSPSKSPSKSPCKLDSPTVKSKKIQFKTSEASTISDDKTPNEVSNKVSNESNSIKDVRWANEESTTISDVGTMEKHKNQNDTSTAGDFSQTRIKGSTEPSALETTVDTKVVEISEQTLEENRFNEASGSSSTTNDVSESTNIMNEASGSSSSSNDAAVSSMSSITKATSSSCLDEDEDLSGVRIFVIVRDMSASSALVNKDDSSKDRTYRVTIVTCAKSTCGELMQEVARRFKYEADSFSLILQRSNGDQVEVERLESERTLEHAGFQVENTPRNNLILCDLGGQPPRRTDDDDLSLGASASPTANSTEKKWFDRGSNNQESSSTTNTTQDYSYASAVIKHETGYVGLVNQAMTCYLNSLLQTLFMTPEFRNALYHWEFKGTEDDASKNIPCQLQRLFLLLQTVNRSAIETTNLTRSFGWDSSEAWQQHDIQELCRVMFDALEQCFKKTDQSDLIKNLYEGKMKDYVKCLECGNERAREDTYLDVPLPIRPFGAQNAYKSVEEALKAFIEPELLTGSNQYKCSNCDTLCDAHKGLKFTRFPYLLTIHLMRFDFDYNTLHRIKLNDKVTFPNILDLNSFVDDPSKPLNSDADKIDAASTTDSGSALDAEDSSVENASSFHPESDNQDEDEGIDVSSMYNERNKSCLMGNGPFVYELFSIMVHSGSASGGHYYAYIKDFTTGEWFCFNDQSVTKITYDDIRKTYGGGNSRSYYSSWSSSANAYMLMYRQVDKERNVSSLVKDELPKHIKSLVDRMNNEEAAEREAREMERCMCHIKLFCQHPKQNQMVEKKLHIHKDTTLAETVKLAYNEMSLEGIVPLDQCRLVKYEEFHDSLEASYEGQEEECISEILGGVRSTYKFDLLLESRDKDKEFEVYKPGGTTVKVHIVNLSTEEVEGPFTLRASLTMTVKEFKDMLGRSLNQNADNMRVVLERYYNDLRPLTNVDKTLKMEGFYRSNKIYIEASGEEQNDWFTGSQMYRILDRFENTITLFCSLPDASSEALKELQIPPYVEEESEVVSSTSDSGSSTSAAPGSSTAATLSAAASFDAASSPAESAASPASCSSKDSGISSKGIETSGSEISSSSSSSSNAQSPSTSVAAAAEAVAATAAGAAETTTHTSEKVSQGSGKKINWGASLVYVESNIYDPGSSNGSDGEDEGIADADSATGGSNVNSDQSASEDSSLTSDSDRTLVGDPPEDKLSDASNSPDYRNVSSPEDNSRDTKDTELGWGDDDKEVEVKRYFRANYFTEDSTNQKMLRVSVDKRITIGLLKTNMQKWVGVSTEHFKIFKIYSSSQEFECTRMTETLASYGDNTRLSVRLGRALLPGEQRGKVYLLEPENSEDPAKFLIDWVICNGDSVANAKKAIIREVNSRCNMSLTPEKVRLRKKSWKNPQTIYLDNQLFEDDIPFYSNWELFVQVLDGPEMRSDNQEELAIFVKRWCPSTFTTVPLAEIIIPKATSEDLKKKLSDVSGIAPENIEFAKGKGTFPCDMSMLDINNDLDWTPREGPLDQRPLYILDDGAMIYYRDKTESLKNLSEDERRDVTSAENKRLNRDLGYTCSSTTTSNYSSLRSKEKGLKIYLNHDD